MAESQIARVQLPDGRIGRFEVPAGTSPQQAEAFALEQFGGVNGGNSAQLAPAGKPGVLEDIVKSIPGAIPRAAAALVGLPQSLMSLAEAGARKFGGGDIISRASGVTPMPPSQNIGDLVTEGYDRLSEAVTGKPVYRPQTGPGRVADLTAQTLVSGPGSLVQKGAMGATAGLTGETARASGITNPIALGVLQMLGAGAASLPFILRSVPADNINQAIKGITAADLAKAQSLMDDATRMGAPITGAEAIAKVTGRNNLQDIQRVIEGSRESSPITEGMMNARPAASRAAFENEANKITTMPAEPSRTPVRMQQGAEQAITKARQAGNAAAGPDYATASTQSVPSSSWNTLTTEPAAQKALQAVKQATEYGVTNEREGSIRWLDAAKRWLDAKIQEAPAAERRIWEQGRQAITTTADAASPEYARARATVAANRQNVVDPMQQSPVGDIAASRGNPTFPASAEQAMRSQSEILMPQAPRALDPMTIRKTVATISKQDPQAAAAWTRQNLEAIFNESAQANVGGANQWGGAKFAAQLAGNPAQRDNLQALIESTGGRPAWVGFNRMLEVMEAQGKRLAPGSNTARDIRTGENLGAAGLGGAPAVAASPTRLGSIVYDWYQNFRFGKNTAEMARILVDPKSVDLMQRLAKEAPNTAKSSAMVAEIISGSAPSSADASNTNR